MFQPLWVISLLTSLLSATSPDPLVQTLVSRLDKQRTRRGFIRDPVHVDSVIAAILGRTSSTSLAEALVKLYQELVLLRQPGVDGGPRKSEYHAYLTASRVASMTMGAPLFGLLTDAITRSLRFDGFARVAAEEVVSSSVDLDAILSVFAYTGKRPDYAQRIYKRFMALWLSSSSEFSPVRVTTESLSRFLSRLAPLEAYLEFSKLLKPLVEDTEAIAGSAHFAKVVKDIVRRGWTRIACVHVWLTLARVEAAVAIWRAASDFATELVFVSVELDILLDACKALADEALVLAENLQRGDVHHPNLVLPILAALDDLINQLDGLWGPELLDDMTLVAKSMRQSFEGFLVSTPSITPPSASPFTAKFISFLPLENPSMFATRASWSQRAPRDLVDLYSQVRAARVALGECLLAQVAAVEAKNSLFGPAWNRFAKQMTLELFDAGELVFQLGQFVVADLPPATAVPAVSRLTGDDQFKLLSEAFCVVGDVQQWVLGVDVCGEAQTLLTQIMAGILQLDKANYKRMAVVCPENPSPMMVTTLRDSKSI